MSFLDHSVRSSESLSQSQDFENDEDETFSANTNIKDQQSSDLKEEEEDSVVRMAVATIDTVCQDLVISQVCVCVKNFALNVCLTERK
jgi:hypothetical protein